MDVHNSDPFSQSFDYASGKTGERFQNPFWQLTEIFFGSHFRNSVANVKDFGSVIVANAVKFRTDKKIDKAVSMGDSKTFEGISGSLINSLLDSINDHEMVADAALNYLSAGKLLYLGIPSASLNITRKRYHSPSIDLDVLSSHA